jgi:hypothetical protein
MDNDQEQGTTPNKPQDKYSRYRQKHLEQIRERDRLRRRQMYAQMRELILARNKLYADKRREATKLANGPWAKWFLLASGGAMTSDALAKINEKHPSCVTHVCLDGSEAA